MADNYLEKQMDDYRNGRLGRPSTRRGPLDSGHGHVRAFVIGGDTPAGIEWVKRLRGYGWQVAFTDQDVARGRKMAQAVGAQHHPVDWHDESRLLWSIDEIGRRWGAIDVAVNCVGELQEEVVEALKGCLIIEKEKDKLSK